MREKGSAPLLGQSSIRVQGLGCGVGFRVLRVCRVVRVLRV